LNTLTKVERAENFKFNASPEFPEERMPFLQRFARFMRFKEREAVSVRKNEWNIFNRPPPW
jgi:hypothetical protein